MFAEACEMGIEMGAMSNGEMVYIIAGCANKMPHQHTHIHNRLSHSHIMIAEWHVYAKRSKPKRVSSAKEKKPFIYTFAIVLNRPLCRRSKVNIRDICYFQRTLGFAHHTVVFIRYTLRSIACILLYMCETYVNRRLTIHRFSCEHELHPNQCVCVCVVW